MKPLNRPMFRYGGPIKEGIMTGMKDNTGTGLVGDKRYPKTDGRSHHFAVLPFIGMGINALRAIPAGMRAARFFGATPGKLGFFGRAKDLLTPRAGLKLQEGGKKFPGLSEFAAKAEPGTGAGFRIGSFIKQNPILSASTPSLAYDAARIGGPAAGEGLKAVANFLVPGTKFDPFKDKKEEVPTGDGTKLKRGDKSKNVGDTSVTGTTKPGQAGGTTVKSDAEKQQINEARIQETKDRYYKLMGIDKMNKDAVYDSLIDASKIVQEEGADLKGAIKSGNLQSRIIEAISGQLDKSAALKRQIDAAVLKGEIEKDIKASDPDAALDKEYKRTQIALGKKKLEGPSAADVMSSATIDGKNIVTSNTLTQVLSGMGRDVDFTFPDDKYQKWEKSNEGKDEIDYLTENYGSLDDGLYVVNKKAFEVRDGSVFQVDLDKVTG